MITGWPAALETLESFATKHGLRLDRQVQSGLGEKLVVYRDDTLAVRLISDRGSCVFDIAEVRTRPDDWYDAAIIRDFVEGRGDDVLSPQVQLQIIDRCWDAIHESFNEINRESSHTQISLLRKQRAKRLFPKWYQE
jgi:hypothetical protein